MTILYCIGFLLTMIVSFYLLDLKNENEKGWKLFPDDPIMIGLISLLYALAWPLTIIFYAIHFYVKRKTNDN